MTMATFEVTVSCVPCAVVVQNSEGKSKLLAVSVTDEKESIDKGKHKERLAMYLRIQGYYVFSPQSIVDVYEDPKMVVAVHAAAAPADVVRCPMHTNNVRLIQTSKDRSTM